MRIVIAALIGSMALVACAATPEATPSGSASPSVSVEPSPSSTPTPQARAVLYDLAFHEGRQAQPEGDVWLYLVDEDQYSRAAGPSPLRFLSPRFVTENTYAFIARNEQSGANSVRVVTAGGQPEVVLAAEDGRHISAFDVTPDGETYAVMRGKDGTSSIVLVHGGEQSEIWSSSNPMGGRGGTDDDETALHWSPDGERLLVVITGHDNLEETIYVLDPKGREVVTPRFGTFARWSADSSTVLYRRWGGDAWFRLDVAADTQQRIDIPRGGFRPTLSPDGTRIAYDDGLAAASTFVFDIETGTENKVGPGVAPIWLSDDRIATTQVVSCSEKYADDVTNCGLAPPWVAQPEVLSFSASGGGRQMLALVSTIDADVLF